LTNIDAQNGGVSGTNATIVVFRDFLMKSLYGQQYGEILKRPPLFFQKSILGAQQHSFNILQDNFLGGTKIWGFSGEKRPPFCLPELF